MEKAFLAARWALALPLAVICAYLAYLLSMIANSLSTLFVVGQGSWVKFIVEMFAHMIMGSAFVLTLVKVCPAAPRLVAGAGISILTLLAVASLWSSLVLGKFEAVPAVLLTLTGGIGVLVAAMKGEITPFKGNLSIFD